ncbi:MAG: alpha/beta hydrolase, partial [Chitinophagaceae bacterium]
YINLPDGFDAVYLEWIPPLQKESLRDYALRLAQKIDTSQPFALVGLSMGGMIAAEIAKHYNPFATILISSVSCSAHLPGYLKVAGKLGIHKLVPVSFVKSAAIIKRFFAGEKPEDRKLLKQIIRESDPVFIRWAMNAIIQWRCDDPPQNFIHIHGSRDEVIPLRYTKPTHVIPKAGHLMVLTKSEEVNGILQEKLKQVN